MLFMYICVGFEGSAHDTTVLRHCLSDPNMGFHHPPPGKYYLVDSGYPNSTGYLSPYQEKGLRVHTPEFRNGPPPKGKLEHFNYRHSSLRGTVERIFGVLKNRWKILRMMPKMDDAYQLAIIVATCTLHNFIRLHDLGIPVSQVVETMEPRADLNLTDKTRTKNMEITRAKIADEIWLAVDEENVFIEEDDVEDEERYSGEERYSSDDNEPLGWQVVADEKTGQSYVATGGNGFGFNPTESFNIQQIEGNNNVYKIRFAGESDVGFFEKDGLLGITNEIPLPVVFQKAFDVLAMV
ncbi:uncharacterized protein LOC130591198 [Beta vulgaris subsp. vulgaris]|uniref:uncharacterized protein LOC130591198 n=1 Tax=Beta vulgaris subsp. vulgaris TaxID=3555 RepID=UPI002546EE3C|nr:uncharacterized protein LOC130591198 [Beta vulgaris subsp. vulgaris]